MQPLPAFIVYRSRTAFQEDPYALSVLNSAAGTTRACCCACLPRQAFVSTDPAVNVCSGIWRFERRSHPSVKLPERRFVSLAVLFFRVHSGRAFRWRPRRPARRAFAAAAALTNGAAVEQNLNGEVLVVVGARLGDQRIVKALVLFALDELLKRRLVVIVPGPSYRNIAQISRSMIPFAASKPPSM